MPGKHQLKQIEWPEFGLAEHPPQTSQAEHEERIAAARAAMDERGLTHLVVYGDREHFANMAYLTGFDPRFEEALLVLRPDGVPLAVVGNECEGYLAVSPLLRGGALRVERFQPFSLLDQPRGESRLIRDILADEGIGQGAVVGSVGWKYLGESEHPDAVHALDVPSYLADTLRDLAGRENVTNETAIFMHPGYGLRSVCSASEIAYFEYTNVLASEGMKRIVFGIREGMADTELAELGRLNGVPLGCHMTLVTGDTRDYGMSSPMGAPVRRGDPMAMNICYWGCNICRAGWVAEDPSDLPAGARDYVESFAGVYFEALARWYGKLRIGTAGGALAQVIEEDLPSPTFGITLNPGHLIHLEEWLSSPIYSGSELELRSGMAIQVDVIPSHPVYFSTRMEDGLVLADEGLRSRLRSDYPDCYGRCQKRREFMVDVLGISLPEEVLPLSNIPGVVPPFFMDPNTVLALER